MNPRDIINSFTCHALKDDQPIRYETIREKALSLAEYINQWCPESREKSLAITKLEEAVMWANKAIACNE